MVLWESGKWVNFGIFGEGGIGKKEELCVLCGRNNSQTNKQIIY